ncbi:MAG: type I DNA topoisomerase [Candidatus Omnitrophica bacterium]|nr:type I DNA topoisomerase [Candidatus Omnitrophota bacterium]
MSKKAIVIVESPAKSKTINKILGPDYVVLSSMGHIVDLPKNKMGIDVENDFKPEYIVIQARRKYMAQLKKEVKKVDTIYLAADPDREGEAISWHLKKQLGKGKKVFRVTFDEITETAVKKAFKNPHPIDINLVNAQQARRILDRIVGYSLSPLLWKKVTRGLSAGRVQSVAVRLVVDREAKIKKFVPDEYWDIEAHLKKKNKEERRFFSAKLEKINKKDFEIKNEKDIESTVEDIKKNEFVVSKIKEAKKKRSPQAPFTTSKMQQDSFNKLHFPVNKTMRVAQQLYEGVELEGKESVGLITYMRTDSVKVSHDAQEAAAKHILKVYGKKYYPQKPNVYKSKKRAQEAHECIRPTLPLRTPESVREFLEPDQFKLYELVWKRFISSQMTPALHSVNTVEIEAGIYLFRTSGTKVVFDGFMVLYPVITAPEAEDEKRQMPWKIPMLEIGERLNLMKLIPSQHFTKPPARYSDATLVKALEEKGIGRPSTYAPIISTIIIRHYVKRIRGYLHPTELGDIIIELLVKHFPKIMESNFTAEMENELDDIEEGKIEWRMVLKNFYAPFMSRIDAAKENMKSIKKEGVKTDEICDLCGKHMIIKWGRRGKFLSCSDFPRCKFAKSITTGIKCPAPDCEGELIERRSKRGPFYGCTKYPNCKYTSRGLPKQEENPEETKKEEPKEDTP